MVRLLIANEVAFEGGKDNTIALRTSCEQATVSFLCHEIHLNMPHSCNKPYKRSQIQNVYSSKD